MTLPSRFFFRRAALGALALACAALAAPAAWAQQKTVGITAIVEHPALDAIRKGAQDELRALGWSEDKLKVQYQSAQGSAATAGQIAKKFAGDKVDAIIAIATPSAQAAAKVLDMGCGTGILAIMAALRGAHDIIAIDIDPWCVENATENVQQNNCAFITVKQGEVSAIAGEKYNLSLDRKSVV